MNRYMGRTIGGRQMRPVHHQQQVVVVQQPQPLRLPGFMTRLRVLCDGDGGRRHPLPVQCNWQGPAVSNNGNVVAKYVCPLCGKQLFWGVSHQTGRPFVVWTER